MESFVKTVAALHDETRVLLLCFLQEHGECCVCDLQSSLNMIQSRLSRHLKILKEAGFIEVQRRGTWAYYSLKTPLDSFREEALREIRSLHMQVPSLKKVSQIQGCAL